MMQTFSLYTCRVQSVPETGKIIDEDEGVKKRKKTNVEQLADYYHYYQAHENNYKSSPPNMTNASKHILTILFN